MMTDKTIAMAGNRTRVNCLEGSYAHHYTTIATCLWTPYYYNLLKTVVSFVFWNILRIAIKHKNANVAKGLLLKKKA